MWRTSAYSSNEKLTCQYTSKRAGSVW